MPTDIYVNTSILEIGILRWPSRAMSLPLVFAPGLCPLPLLPLVFAPGLRPWSLPSVATALGLRPWSLPSVATTL